MDFFPGNPVWAHLLHPNIPGLAPLPPFPTQNGDQDTIDHGPSADRAPHDNNPSGESALGHSDAEQVSSGQSTNLVTLYLCTHMDEFLVIQDMQHCNNIILRTRTEAHERNMQSDRMRLVAEAKAAELKARIEERKDLIRQLSACIITIVLVVWVLRATRDMLSDRSFMGGSTGVMPNRRDLLVTDSQRTFIRRETCPTRLSTRRQKKNWIKPLSGPHRDYSHVAPRFMYPLGGDRLEEDSATYGRSVGTEQGMCADRMALGLNVGEGGNIPVKYEPFIASEASELNRRVAVLESLFPSFMRCQCLLSVVKTNLVRLLTHLVDYLHIEVMGEAHQSRIVLINGFYFLHCVAMAKVVEVGELAKAKLVPHGRGNEAVGVVVSLVHIAGFATNAAERAAKLRFGLTWMRGRGGLVAAAIPARYGSSLVGHDGGSGIATEQLCTGPEAGQKSLCFRIASAWGPWPKWTSRPKGSSLVIHNIPHFRDRLPADMDWGFTRDVPSPGDMEHSISHQDAHSAHSPASKHTATPHIYGRIGCLREMHTRIQALWEEQRSEIHRHEKHLEQSFNQGVQNMERAAKHARYDLQTQIQQMRYQEMNLKAERQQMSKNEKYYQNRYWKEVSNSQQMKKWYEAEIEQAKQQERARKVELDQALSDLESERQDLRCLRMDAEDHHRAEIERQKAQRQQIREELEHNNQELKEAEMECQEQLDEMDRQKRELEKEHDALHVHKIQLLKEQDDLHRQENHHREEHRIQNDRLDQLSKEIQQFKMDHVRILQAHRDEVRVLKADIKASKQNPAQEKEIREREHGAEVQVLKAKLESIREEFAQAKETMKRQNERETQATEAESLTTDAAPETLVLGPLVIDEPVTKSPYIDPDAGEPCVIDPTSVPLADAHVQEMKHLRGTKQQPETAPEHTARLDTATRRKSMKREYPESIDKTKRQRRLETLLEESSGKHEEKKGLLRNMFGWLF
ncbi:hypothetical protein B0T17DRAFT_509298 [Bombardia bombarda]|uniref:Uncharacterized protein n=1 Tax=Bombardia bombarda TaxID=252184 RepID=A0AA39WUT0_9PEZI|nr:hypothetical protein B0T17DRAFT_509298 [Bombardia bombarda]